MRGAAAETWARRLGALAGAVLAVVVLAGAQVAPGSGRLGLDLTVAMAPTGEVAITPPGPVLSRAGMAPGSAPARGAVELRNQTGRRLPFDLRALPSSRDGDRLLVVRVDSGGRRLYEGPLGGLRRPGAARLALAARERRTLRLSAWVEPRAGGRHAGRIVEVLLELRPEGRR